jgi:hypothetical protein
MKVTVYRAHNTVQIEMRKIDAVGTGSRNRGHACP